jgi:Alw26I/Eco31I/Esp3I family type II restriction endonuclease
VNSTKVTPTTTPTVTHQKTNNEDDFDNISDITMNTRSYANPKPPPTKPKEVTPTTMEPKDAEVEQDNSTFIRIEQDNKVYLKEVESNKVFELNILTGIDTIFDIYDRINHTNKSELFTKYFGKSIDELKIDCYSDKYCGGKLSPGVMANPPDRLDGFHSYNSFCCRKKNDKGRSDENMKSYTRDRRSYEMFSDGDNLLANIVMGKLNTVKTECYVCNKTAIMTADHIGPISLGFVHDPINFQSCCSACNSSKNNRLTKDDVNTLRTKEEVHAIVSWWAKECWDTNKEKDAKSVKTAMDNNAKKFLKILEWLKTNKIDIIKEVVEKDYSLSNKSYTISSITVDSSNGKIIFIHNSKESTKKTKETQQKRSKEILLEISEKNNRKNKVTLTDSEITALSIITYETFRETICKILTSN